MNWRSSALAPRWMIGIALTLAALLFASWQSAAWATPPQDPLRQTVPTPTAGQTVKLLTPTTAATTATTAGDVQVTVPVGAVTAEISIALTPQTVTEVTATQTPPAGFRLLGHAVKLEIFDGLTKKPGFVFAKPVNICMTYTTEDLAAIGGDPANFVVTQFKDNGTTVTHTPTVDAANKKVCFDVTSLSTFVLSTSVPAALPAVGEAALPRVLLGLALLGALLLGSGLLVRRWAR